MPTICCSNDEEKPSTSDCAAALPAKSSVLLAVAIAGSEEPVDRLDSTGSPVLPPLARRFNPQYFLTRTGVVQVNLSQS
eukprot:COSAG01_NODE_8576_length_2733_cov_1.781784_2_plen_78_part_01